MEAEGSGNEETEGSSNCNGMKDGDCCGEVELERTERAIIIHRNNQAKTSRYHLGKLGLSFSVLTSMLGSSSSVPRSLIVVDFEESTHMILPEVANKTYVNHNCSQTSRHQKKGYLCLCCGHKQNGTAAEDEQGTMTKPLSSYLGILNHY